MRLIFSVFIAMFMFCPSYGQEQSMLFEKWWGVNDGCQLYYADELPNGDYLLIGARKSVLFPPGQGYFKQYVCRTDKSGILLWEKEIGFPYANDYGGNVLKTSWGTYLIVGSTEGDSLPGYRNIAARNIDANGNIIFERFFTSGFYNDGGNAVETSDSCFVFLCKLGIPSTFYQAAGIIKIDRDGNELWRHRYDTIPNSFFYQIKQTPDSGFIALGQGTVTSYDCVYGKFKPDGNLDWIKYPFGSTDTIPNFPTVLRANSNGTFDIVYGTHYNIQQFPTEINVYEMFKHYDSFGNEISSSVYTEALGNIIVNNEDSAFWAMPMYTSLYIMDEDSIYRRKVGFEDDETLLKGVYSFIPTSDGGYLAVGGYTYDNVNVLSQFYMAKFGDGRYKPLEFSESVNVYPNPSADGNVNLTFDMLADENVQVDIFSTDGKLLYSHTIFCPANSHTEMPLRLFEHSVSGGMYILQARTSKEVIRKKFILE